ncbi:MAG: sel1 repeat family protein [Proteobacteria bacterium]|nr:sel1 repeat family protein [Pseudomonadota bacterium]
MKYGRLPVVMSIVFLAACSRSGDNNVQTAASDQSAPQSSEPVITEFFELSNGRICSYNPKNSFEASFYQKAQARKEAKSVPNADISADNADTIEETALPKVEAGQTCQAHNQCPPGHACMYQSESKNPETGKIEYILACTNMVSRECATDLDCPEYEKCFDNHCAMCKTDADCRYGNTCSKGACFPKNEPAKCQEATDCSYGEICLYGECSAFCHNTCADGKTCQGTVGIGVCLDTHAQQYSTLDKKWCLSNEDAELNYVCLNHESRKACMNDTDCPDGRQCLNSICQECTQDSECKHGRCINSICGCSSDEDCYGSSRCSDNHQCVACLSDSDCPGGKCNEENKCAECVTSSDCAKGMVCGNPPGWIEYDTPKCIQCVSDEDCSSETPFCNAKGKCEPIQCTDVLDCCYGEYCIHNQCKAIQMDLVGLRPTDSYAKTFKDEALPKGHTADADIQKQATRRSKLREMGYYTTTPNYCTAHDECDSGSWCNKSLHICMDTHRQKYLNPEFSYYLSGQISYNDIIYTSDFCWHDSDCPSGQVCSDFGICGCNRDSCGEGYECSARFGCINLDESLCGTLEQKDNKCRCHEDSQCGEDHFCASNGTCESVKDPEILFLEGLRWSAAYHGRIKNREKTIEYLQKSANLGNDEAKLTLAIEYINEDASYAQGITLLNELIQINHPEACYQYALLLNDGIIKPDAEPIDKGILVYLEKAANAGHTYAQALLAALYSGYNKSLHFHDYSEIDINKLNIQPDKAKAETYYNMFFTYTPSKYRSDEMDSLLKSIF